MEHLVDIKERIVLKHIEKHNRADLPAMVAVIHFLCIRDKHHLIRPKMVYLAKRKHPEYFYQIKTYIPNLGALNLKRTAHDN